MDSARLEEADLDLDNMSLCSSLLNFANAEYQNEEEEDEEENEDIAIRYPYPCAQKCPVHPVRSTPTTSKPAASAVAVAKSPISLVPDDGIPLTAEITEALRMVIANPNFGWGTDILKHGVSAKAAEMVATFRRTHKQWYIENRLSVATVNAWQKALAARKREQAEARKLRRLQQKRAAAVARVEDDNEDDNNDYAAAVTKAQRKKLSTQRYLEKQARAFVDDRLKLGLGPETLDIKLQTPLVLAAMKVYCNLGYYTP